MNPVQLPMVAPNGAQPAGKAVGRAPAQGSDAAPADGAEGGFAALMQQLAAPVGEVAESAISTLAPQPTQALAQDPPLLASAAPAEATDPALLAMAPQALPQDAPPMAGLSMRGEAAAPDAQAQDALAGLDTRALAQRAAGVAGRAGQGAASQRDAVVPHDATHALPPYPAMPAQALMVEATRADTRSDTGAKAVDAAPRDLPTPSPLHLAAAPAAPALTSPALLEASLQARPGEPRFAHELATQLQVMVDGEIEHARLQLHPAELGPIHVTMTVQAQTADIQFHAAHASTRQGLQDGLEELRRLLGEMGLQLGQANVGTGQQQQQHEPGSFAAGGAARSMNTAPTGIGSEAPRPGRTVRETLGLLDLYA